MSATTTESSPSLSTSPHSPSLDYFEATLSDRAQDHSDESVQHHRRLCFVNRSLLSAAEVEAKLSRFLADNLNTLAQAKLSRRLNGCHPEARVCECLRVVIKLGKARADRHVNLYRTVCGLIRAVQHDDHAQDLALVDRVLDKCSLAVFDSFSQLYDMRRLMRETARIYKVPYYYDCEDGAQSPHMPLRSDLLAAYKRLSSINDELELLAETLAELRAIHSGKMLAS